MSAVDRDKATRAACECAGEGDGEMSETPDTDAGGLAVAPVAKAEAAQ